MLEEWLRFLVAAAYSSRGYIVVFDRHFYADYYQSEVDSRPVARRRPFVYLHAWMLTHAFPKPALVICLDAPARVLFSRKREQSTEWLDRRRQEYLRLGEVFPAFTVVDADRPVDAVVTDVAETIRNHWKATAA